MRKRNLDNYKFEDTISYSTLRTIQNEPVKRYKRMDRPLPEDVYTGWDETGYGGTVLADGATPADPGYNDRPKNPSYGSVADSYWQALAASKGQMGRPRARPHDYWYDGDAKPRGRPILDEEVPKPNSNANPSPAQIPAGNTNPDKPKVNSTPAFVPIAAGDDAPNDSEDTYVEPLPGSAGADENIDPYGVSLYDNNASDYGQPGAAGGPENNNPTGSNPTQDPTLGQVPSIGVGSGGNSNPSVTTAQTNNIPCTACLTPEEFAKMKALVFQLSQDVRATEEELKHKGSTAGPLTTTAGKADENPQTSYSKPDDNLGTNKDKDNRKKPKDGHKKQKQLTKTKQDDKLLTKEQKDEKAGSTASSKDKGLLGMGALLGGTAAFYGFMEGVSSQYVIGTGALALYCLVNTLDLQV